MPKRRKHARKRVLKKKLTITVSPEIRVKAEILAKDQCRSISSLFEYLVMKYDKLLESENKPPDPRTDNRIYRISSPVPHLIKK